jgi:DNA-binding NtrC family response regulator
MMVSAYGDADRRRSADELGAADFLTKPVDFALLKATAPTANRRELTNSGRAKGGYPPCCDSPQSSAEWLSPTLLGRSAPVQPNSRICPLGDFRKVCFEAPPVFAPMADLAGVKRIQPSP